MGKTLMQCWKEDFWLKILTITSILLIIFAFIVPPTAVIDGSVLAATGELMGIGAIWQFTKAINKNLDTKIRVKEIELEMRHTNDTKIDDIEE